MDKHRLAGTLLIITVASTAVACDGADSSSGAASPSATPSSTSASSASATSTSASSGATPSDPPTEVLSPLFEEALPNVEDRTFTSAIVDFPPAARAVPHRHGDAFVYAYVLDGDVRSRLAGQPAHTYHQGQNWVEQPGAHHLLTENLSTTEPARLLVIFISTTGDELKVDDPSTSPR